MKELSHSCIYVIEKSNIAILQYSFYIMTFPSHLCNNVTSEANLEPSQKLLTIFAKYFHRRCLARL